MTLVPKRAKIWSQMMMKVSTNNQQIPTRAAAEMSAATLCDLSCRTCRQLMTKFMTSFNN
jgi:hypothetical protein